jgi:ubiquinone/menaquinone biosynthesis C-methylase UbiE
VAPARYSIRGGLAGRERLRVLSRVHGPATKRLLERLGIEPGMRCLDVGCGGGDVTLTLARRVGPAGAVVGVDLDEVKLGLAREEAGEAGVANVEYRAGDAYDLPAGGGFDLVYSRFLLAHLNDPARAVRATVAAARPGGVVAVEDVDFSAAGMCHPESEAYRRLWQVWPPTIRAHGGDANLAPQLPRMLAEAGVTELDAAIDQPAGADRDVKLMPALSVENSAEAIVAARQATVEEVEAMVAELYALVDNPATVLALPRVVQAWGRVPA